MKQSLDAINSNLKDVHKASTLYSKALDKRLKAKPATATEENQLSSDTLLDRAIGMHLLREGQFGVATAFLEEMPESANSTSMDADDGSGTPISLKTRFEHMYYILEEMRSNRNLDPAMEWARARRGQLQARGSDLEFELTKLQFIWLFAGRADSPVTQRLMAATRYAREALSRFEGRYLRDIEQLVGSLAFSSGLDSSPYRSVFEGSGAWDEVALTFTREFCSLLGLSADSPLFVATTAGAMALPRLDKLHTIMKEKRTEWTTAHELPVSAKSAMWFITDSFRSRFPCLLPIVFIPSLSVLSRKSRLLIRIRQCCCLAVMSLLKSRWPGSARWENTSAPTVRQSHFTHTLRGSSCETLQRCDWVDEGSLHESKELDFMKPGAKFRGRGGP